MKRNHLAKIIPAAVTAAAMLSTAALAAGPLSSGTGSAPAAVESFSAFDRHINTVASLIASLPERYAAFTPRDHRDFDRAKVLMEELSRQETYAMLDRYEAEFDKYNVLFAQEKMANF